MRWKNNDRLFGIEGQKDVAIKQIIVMRIKEQNAQKSAS